MNIINNLQNKLKTCTVHREELIDLYLMHKMADEDMIIFEEHFFSCKSCCDELDFRISLREVLHSDIRSESTLPIRENAYRPVNSLSMPIQSSEKNVWKKYFSYAASVAAVFLAVFLYFDQDNLFNPSNKVNYEQLAEAYGNNFRTSEYFESQIRLQNREQNLIHLVTQNTEFQKNSTIQFEWRTSLSESAFKWGYLTFFVLNSLEEKIIERRLDSPSIMITEPLEPGLYYWLLESELETELVGRFVVLPADVETTIGN